MAATIPSEQRAATADVPPRTVAVPQAVLVGAGAGMAAALVMSMVMLPARWLGLLGTQPPRRITDRLLDVAGGSEPTPEPARRVGTALVHLATGAVCGAVFGLARVVTHRRFPTAVVGPAYGAGVWTFAYAVAAPTLELLPPPWRDRPARPQVMLVAHLFFGLVTATLFDRAIESAPSGGTRRS
ncbi:MAG: hypothetical protein H0U52_01955 [Chloroflexi bacterium]|nr:hypothetical protein [Chloroflexota bacterium]